MEKKDKEIVLMKVTIDVDFFNYLRKGNNHCSL